MDLNNKFKKAFEKIKQANNVLLACHERPDGDAVSSLLAMSEFMEILGKKYTPFCIDKPEEIFSYLPHFEKINNDKENLNFSSFDVIIILDCGQLDRAKIVDEVNSRNKNQFVIEFDHHPKMYDYSDLEIRIDTAASTTEVLYQFFKANKFKINKNIANCILTGISTDTANFLYPSTSDLTLQAASEMLIRGAQLPKVIKETWYNKNLATMKLWGIALSRLQINKKYNFAFSVITLDDINKIGKEKIDKEIFNAISGFISGLHKVKGTILFREEENNKIKASVRSNHPNMDISKLAAFCGGGGHARSSGFLIDGKFKKQRKNYRII